MNIHMSMKTYLEKLKKQLEQLEDLSEHRENPREHREKLTFNIARSEYYFTQNAIRTHNN